MNGDRLFALVIVLSALYGCSTRAETVDAPAAPKLRIDLSVENPKITVGDEPRFTARLINDGPAPATIVRPGDGSWAGWRTPILSLNPPLPKRARCGNINALRADEVVTLATGESIPISCSWRWEPVGVGVHRFSLTMENVPDMEWAGIPLGPHDPEALEQVRRTLPFKVVSNVVEVEVRPVESR